ncbi:FAD-dependent monooxygenase BOA8 like protein [Verticillium longisporum]|nr:FAD-dependent monooxygenase BOA8 like protein [Verticillium longisporum]
MLDKNDFKVIIVGGGVAGLALANMLEQYGWDYLILESHSAIAPQVGASIGMFPNGLRILDQLGLYAPIHAHFEGQTRCETFYTRRADGTIISQLNDVRTHLERSFGIAKNVPGWVDGTQHTIVGQGMSQLVVSGPENKVYWFLFERLPRPNYGKDIAPYSREDEAEFSTSTLTPLHEVVYEKWFYKRIITIGDSAHKPNPVGGQGANGAIESCAELINALVRMRDGRGGDLKGLTTEEVIQVSHEMQTARHERAELIVSSSHQRQALFAFEKPLQSRLILDWVSPVFGSESLLNRIASNYLGATIIKTLPVPYRERSIPFNDELQSAPVPNKASATGRRIMIGVMALALLVTSTAWRVDLDELQGLGPKNVTRSLDNVVAAPTPSTLNIEAFSTLSIIYPLTHNERPSGRAVPLEVAGSLTLKSTYSFAFGAWVNRTLLPSTNLTVSDIPLSNMGEDFDSLHKYDLMAGLAAVIASKMYSIWDLRRLGYIKTLEAIEVASV